MQLKHFVGLSALVAGAAFMAGRVSAEKERLQKEDHKPDDAENDKELEGLCGPDSVAVIVCEIRKKETKDNDKPEVQSEAAEEPATKTETGTPEKEEENA